LTRNKGIQLHLENMCMDTYLILRMCVWNESCHTYEWVMPHHTYGCLILRMCAWMGILIRKALQHTHTHTATHTATHCNTYVHGYVSRYWSTHIFSEFIGARWTFSKVSSIVLLYGVCSSEVTFENMCTDLSACTGENSQKSALHFFYVLFSGASCLLRICAYTCWLALVEILKSQMYSSFIWSYQ